MLIHRLRTAALSAFVAVTLPLAAGHALAQIQPSNLTPWSAGRATERAALATPEQIHQFLTKVETDDAYVNALRRAAASKDQMQLVNLVREAGLTSVTSNSITTSTSTTQKALKWPHIKITIVTKKGTVIVIEIGG